VFDRGKRPKSEKAVVAPVASAQQPSAFPSQQKIQLHFRVSAEDETRIRQAALDVRDADGRPMTIQTMCEEAISAWLQAKGLRPLEATEMPRLARNGRPRRGV